MSRIGFSKERRSLAVIVAGISSIALLAVGCGESGPVGTPTPEPGTTAFLDGESAEVGDGKTDTGWQSSLNAVEVEMDIEGDVDASGFGVERAPLKIGQFALTHLRKNSSVYLQSLAEDFNNGPDSIEWQIDGQWVKLSDAGNVDRSKLSRFRLRAVSAVVINPGDLNALNGKV